MKPLRIEEQKKAARVAIIELRSLLAADSTIGVTRRNSLIRQAASLVEDSTKRELLVARLTALILARFGRNPDDCEVSPAALSALRLLDDLQQGRQS